MSKPAPAPAKLPSGKGFAAVWRNFWFGQSPAEFLRSELHWDAARRILTVRLFITLMAVSLLSVALRPPSVVALSFSFVMMLGPTMLDYTMTLQTARQILTRILAAVGLSVFSLALWGGQPWFLVPWSFALIALLLFYSRVTATSTIPPMLYVFAVLYHPERPAENVQGALWMFPTLGLMAVGISIAAQLILWPQDPEELLQALLLRRLDGMMAALSSLAGESANTVPVPLALPSPGIVSRQFSLLAHAETAHPRRQAQHAEWVDWIAELDNAYNHIAALSRLVATTQPQAALTAPDRANLQAIAKQMQAVRQALAGLPQGQTQRFDRHANPTVPLPQATRQHGLLLQRIGDTVGRLQQALANLSDAQQNPVTVQSMPDSPAALSYAWVRADYWRGHRDALHFGIKFSLGVMICLFLVQALRWPTIDTAILTCVVVAQSSMGSDYRKSVMRIAGASLGGLLAYVFIVIVQPAIETIAGFMLAMAPVCWLGAWVGSGSPRIAYIGTQIAYSFAHAVLPGYGPVLDLASARDRVLGILIGITVVGLLDYLFWPQRSFDMARTQFAAALRATATFLPLGKARDSQASAEKLKAIDASLLKVLTLLESAQFEPAASEPGAASSRARLTEMVNALHGVARVAHARHRYFSHEPSLSGDMAWRKPQQTLETRLAQCLTSIADALVQSDEALDREQGTAVAELHQLARQTIAGLAADADALPAQQAFVDLDRRLLSYFEELVTPEAAEA